MKNNPLFVLLFVLFFSPVLFAADLVQVITKNKDLKQFRAALDKAGMLDTLKSRGPFTVFAPTDAAFKRVDRAALDALFRNQTDLAKVLSYHIVPGRVAPIALFKSEQQMLRTLQGAEITIQRDISRNIWKADHAVLNKSETATDNGLIYTIDYLLTPQPTT